MANVVIPQEFIPKSSFDRLSAVVSTLRGCAMGRERRSNMDLELEFRISLGETSWKQLLGSLEMFAGWTHVEDWRESVDFFYNAGGSLGEIRTSRSDRNGALVRRHLRKRTVETLNLSLANCRIADRIKVTFNTEDEIPEEELGKASFHVNTSNVRIKHRKSFIWNDWRYDMTKTWSSKTFSGASAKMEGGKEPRFEFEIELINPSKFLEKPDHTDDFVAADAVLKIASVLPDQRCQISCE